jgi:F-type H+-transporting ATPase subunit b
VLIDWFTVGAQIVNFLVLIALLKYFLYGRIIKAIDEREKKIASRLEDAEQKKKEAEQEGEAYRTKNQELDAMGERIVAQVREEAETHRRAYAKGP